MQSPAHLKIQPSSDKAGIATCTAETGKVLAREFHGNYSCLIEVIEKWEKAFGRERMLPIEEVTIENQCGYIFRGSTNQIKYIDEHDSYQQSDCA